LRTQILAELMPGSAGKDHICHHQINATTAAFENLQRLFRVLGAQHLKATQLKNAAGSFPDKKFVLDQ
jgi:hypothetical protein